MIPSYLPSPLSLTLLPKQPITAYCPYAPIMPMNAIVPTRAMLTLGSPNSHVGGMRHTLANHFGSLHKTPTSMLALVHNHSMFRVNNTHLQKALKDELTAPQLIKSRFSSNETLAENALMRFLDIFGSLRRPISEISPALLKRSKAEDVFRQYRDITETLGESAFWRQLGTWASSTDQRAHQQLWGANAGKPFVTSDLLRKAEKKVFGK